MSQWGAKETLKTTKRFTLTFHTFLEPKGKQETARSFFFDSPTRR